MKILHLQSGSIDGGAARSAFWLHKALLNLGLDSRLLILSGKKTKDLDKNIEILNLSLKDRVKNFLKNRLNQFPLNFYSKRQNIIFSTAFFGYDITHSKFYEDADIIHLHWINNGMLSLNQISKIKKPIVWTFRDMWPFTGGCHYSLGCYRYEVGCGKCKVLNSRKNIDLSSWVMRLKNRKFQKNIFPVAISNWIKYCAKNSLLFAKNDIKLIHNGVDTELFKPVEKYTAREILGLPRDKRVILVGAQNPKDLYKGFNKFLDSIEYIDKSKYLFVFFGRINQGDLAELNINFKFLGYLCDNYSLVLAYSASDVFVCPSIQEAFGKTIIEAMACGTPVVCFDATGPKDIVDHMVDGYKAKPFDPVDVATGIEWILSNNDYPKICSRARENIIKNFDINLIAKKYKELYESIYPS